MLSSFLAATTQIVGAVGLGILTPEGKPVVPANPPIDLTEPAGPPTSGRRLVSNATGGVEVTVC